MDDRMIAGVRWSIDWLHKRAAGMNDQKATDILHSAATNLGWDLRQHRPTPDRDTVLPLSASDGGGFIAYAAGMPGCTGDGATVEEALEDLENAKKEWLAARERMGRA